nr:MAG TPA: hypothetical protein [Caudoviricetes sp.]
MCRFIHLPGPVDKYGLPWGNVLGASPYFGTFWLQSYGYCINE